MMIGPFRNASESNSSIYTFSGATTFYIISRRQSTLPPTDTVTLRLERMFGVHLRHPVVQTDLKDKTPFIAARHIVYYYGDSDGEIKAAVGARAVPIRVQRSAASYAKDQPHNGQLNEIVLENSRD
jgi:acid phosphatase class B